MQITMCYDLVRYLFDYDFTLGVLIWKNSPPGVNKNAKVGNIINHSFDHGYPCVDVYGKYYKIHRLIWLHVYGYFPENDIDHKDRDKTNNKLNNLREVSRQCNIRNAGLRKDNISGITGVTFAKDRYKWRVSIRVNYKNYKLGDYTELIDAACIRLAAEQCLNWHHCDKDSTALQYVNNWLKEQKEKKVNKCPQ